MTLKKTSPFLAGIKGIHEDAEDDIMKMWVQKGAR